MEPWTNDAGTIADFKSINPNEDFVLSIEIEQFIDIHQENFERESIYFIVAPKGFGKTLFLRYKRFLFQKYSKILATKNIIIIPKDQDVVKGTAAFPSNKETIKLLQGREVWKHLWMFAIGLTFIYYILPTLDPQDWKFISINKQLEKLPKSLKEIVDRTDPDPKNVNPYDIINAILRLSVNDFLNLRNHEGEIIVLIKKLDVPLAMFIDNVDQFLNFAFNEFSENMNEPEKIRSHYFVGLDPFVWYDGQIGLIEAIWTICNELKNTIKIFASIRSEAYLKFLSKCEIAQNVKGSVLEITYSKANLNEIMKKNILNMKTHFIYRKQLKVIGSVNYDQFFAFFGLPNNKIESNRGNKIMLEDIFEYVYRHTLKRPRDIMEYGRALSRIPPDSRDSTNIKDSIHDTSKFIVMTYLRETSPHLKINEEHVKKLWQILESNVLTRYKIRSYCYIATSGKFCDKKCDDCNKIILFLDLYKIGLIGIDLIHEISDKNKIQHFAAPGDIHIQEKDTLPFSDYYYIHPILNHTIRDSQIDSLPHQEMIYRLNDKMIVGDGYKSYNYFINSRFCEIRKNVCGKEEKIEKFGIFLASSKANEEFINNLDEELKKKYTEAQIIKWTDNNFQIGKIFCDEVCPKIMHNYRMISEISDFNPNVFFESGFALGLGRQVVFIKKKEIRPSFDCSQLELLYIEYESIDDLLRELHHRNFQNWGSESFKSLFLNPRIFEKYNDFDNPQKRREMLKTHRNLYVFSFNSEHPIIKKLNKNKNVTSIESKDLDNEYIPTKIFENLINAKGAIFHLAGSQIDLNNFKELDCKLMLLAGVCVSQGIPVKIIQSNSYFYIDVSSITDYIHVDHMENLFDWIGRLK